MTSELTKAAPQGEPVAAQCRFEGDAEWKPCTVAHHLLVQAHQKEWPHYETRALYTAPAPAVPSGWSIADNSDGTITVQGPGMGCIVSDVEANERRVPGEVLHALCRAMLTAAPTPSQEAVVPSNRWLTAAVDAAMVEMKNISPPMRRSECERLIRAALSAAPATPAQSEPAWIERSMGGHHPTDGSTVEWVNTDGDSHITTADKLNWDGDGIAPVVRYRVLSAPAIQPAVPSLQPACRYISDVLSGDASPGEKHIARTIMHLLPLEQAMQATPAVPEDVARDAERYRWLRSYDKHDEDIAICRWADTGWTGEWVVEHDPDAAIDAARKAEKGGA